MPGSHGMIAPRRFDSAARVHFAGFSSVPIRRLQRLNFTAYAVACAR
jgi:hypothetical protein